MGDKRQQLAARRRAAGFTQEALANELSVESSTVRRWELGTRNPGPSIRHSLAAALGLTPLDLDELLDGPAPGQASAQDRAGEDTAAPVPRHQPTSDRGSQVELWELHEALRGRDLGERGLSLVEAGSANLDERYAHTPARVVHPQVRSQLAKVRSYLASPLRIEHRRRLCAVAARLAGLQAWLLFDLAEHRAADAWYTVALDAASEAYNPSLSGWLWGARSLIHHQATEHEDSLRLIEAGLSACPATADASVHAWLLALAARAHAGTGHLAGFYRSIERAASLAQASPADQRRHGMDIHDTHLDVTYYTGTGALLAGQWALARQSLTASLERLPDTRPKAKAVLMLNLADVAAHQHHLDQAATLTHQAITLTRHQPIMPVLSHAHDLTLRLENQHHSSAPRLHDAVSDLADRFRRSQTERVS